MNRDQLLDSLEKIELNLDPEKLYIFTFDKNHWTQEDTMLFARELNRLYPNIKKIFTMNEQGSLNIQLMDKSEKIQLIKELIDSL